MKLVILTHKDLNCVNIHCNKPLTDYELTRQKKKWRYRFCRYCRIMITANRSDVQWKCIGCGVTITTATVIGCYYCGEVCREKTRQDWQKRNRIKLAKNHKRRYRVKKLAAEIAKHGGIEKYKCKITI